MPRLTVPSNTAAWIAARIAAFPTESPELQWTAPYVAEAAALPLYLGWVETIAIRADGEMVSWSTEGDYPGVKSVEERYLWVSALVIGSRRYPELRALLPVRPAEALDCEHFGFPLFAEGKVICSKCCGLGWVENGKKEST